MMTVLMGGSSTGAFCMNVASVHPEKLDNQLTISPSNASQDSVGICIAQVFGHGCLRAFDGVYGLGAMADQ